jgi:predicted acetyltransferase
MIAFFLSILSGIYALFLKLAGRFGLPHYQADFVQTPLPIIAIVMLAISVQFILMGLLAEMLVRTYHESQDKAIYAVRERIGFKDE